MKIAFLMDPLESVKAYKDTSYYLMLACHERDHEVFYFNQNTMTATNGVVAATVQKVQVHASVEQPFTVLETLKINLSAMDAIFVRTEPPLDRAYFYAMLMLDLVGGKTVIVNQPSGIRNWNEKLAALHFPDITPATLITRSRDEILQYRAEFGRLTLKPLDGYGGLGIVFLEEVDKQEDEKIDHITQSGRHLVIAQEYLSAAQEGDKRILLVEGEPIGAIFRVHADGVELNNLDQGGVAEPAELDDVDLAICAQIKEGLIEEGIFFSGIDVIGGKLIEVNVTSPTGLQELSRFNERSYNHDIIAVLENKVRAAHI